MVLRFIRSRWQFRIAQRLITRNSLSSSRSSCRVILRHPIIRCSAQRFSKEWILTRKAQQFGIVIWIRAYDRDDCPHPDPLPQEREQPSSGFSFTRAMLSNPARGFFRRRRTILPLPGGEGRGEGERFTIYSQSIPLPASRKPALTCSAGESPRMSAAIAISYLDRQTLPGISEIHRDIPISNQV